MIEAVIALVAPVAVTTLTSVIKKAPQIAGAAGLRVPIVRAVVAVLSLIAAVLTQMIGEGTVEPGMVETTVYTVFNAVVATALYFWATKK